MLKRNPMDCSPPDFSIYRILQARILEWLHFLLQGIFQTQGSNPSLVCLLHWQAGSLPLGLLGGPTLACIRERTSMKLLCESLRGWDGTGKESSRGMGIYIYIYTHTHIYDRLPLLHSRNQHNIVK